MNGSPPGKQWIITHGAVRSGLMKLLKVTMMMIMMMMMMMMMLYLVSSEWQPCMLRSRRELMVPI